MDRQLKFLTTVFDLEFCETWQNFNSFKQPIEKIEMKVVCMKSEIKQMLKISGLLIDPILQ